MGLKDILVHIDTEGAGAAGERRLGFALSLAAAHEAHLTAVAFALEPTIPPMIMGEVPGTLLEGQRRRSLEVANAAAAAFTEAADRAGIKNEVRVISCTESAAPPTLAVHGRTTDLTIVGQSETEDALAIRDLMTESALFESGRPVLVVPYIGPAEAKLDNIIVAWDGRREASRAANEALPLLVKAKSVSVVVVGGHAPSARGGEPGADLALHLARHGVNVSVKQIGDAGIDVANALLSHAADAEANMIVMGGYGHSRLREFVLGGATRGIFGSMTVPVLMAH